MNDHPSGAYYGEKLSAERLRRCYELAPPRVQQYLAAEIRFVLQDLRSGQTVLELGCGYGRVLVPIAGQGRRVVGIDTSTHSLELAADRLGGDAGCALVAADASDLPFAAGSFDRVICVQNGMSAFGVDRRRLVGEAMRVTAPGGKAVFSSYAAKFWPDRLEWFRIQSQHGLLGEIDEEQTGDGVIVCRDGFRAETITESEFRAIGEGLGLESTISECDGSSLFCIYANLC